MEQIAVIVNPQAAGGRVRRSWTALERTLRRRLGPALEVRWTARPGHAVELAEELGRRGAAVVLSVGGDGTHHEVMCGLMRLSADTRPAFGVLPAGTGGDFCRGVRGGRVFGDVVAALTPGDGRWIDVGWCGYVDDAGAQAGRHFLNLASAGINGMVDRRVNASSKALGGTVTFLKATWEAMQRYRPPVVRLAVDGREVATERASSVVVGNGAWAGGGMMLAPGARLDDGLFEVLLYPPLSIGQWLRLAPDVYRGRHVFASGGVIRAWRGQHVVLEVVEGGDAFLDLDGEAPGKAPARFEVVRGALRLVNPLA